MRIRESGCDSSIVLSEFKFNCDAVDKSIPDPLPQNLNHFLLIVGKPGSSKTTLLMNMICKRYQRSIFNVHYRPHSHTCQNPDISGGGQYFCFKADFWF